MADTAYPVVVVALSEEEGGGFLAMAPDLQGCAGDGETQAEAIADLQDAIAEWIDEALALKREIPGPNTFAYRAKKERDDLHKLIVAQDAVLKKQDKALQDARHEVEEIRGRLDMLESCSGSTVAWLPSHVMEAAVAATGRRRKTDGGKPH